MGLGLRVQADYDTGQEVRWVIPESPAEKAGIQPGDMLLAVNGKDGLIADELLGEKGSTVSMMILSLFGELLCLELERTVGEGDEKDPQAQKDEKLLLGGDRQKAPLPKHVENLAKHQAKQISDEIIERQTKHQTPQITAEQTPSANNVDRAKNTYRLPKFAQLTREEPKVAYCINRSSGADELIGTPLESAEFPPPNKLQIGDIVWFSDYHEQTRLASIVDINTLRSPDVYILELAATMESGGKLVMDIAAYDHAVGAVHAGQCTCANCREAWPRAAPRKLLTDAVRCRNYWVDVCSKRGQRQRRFDSCVSDFLCVSDFGSRQLAEKA